MPVGTLLLASAVGTAVGTAVLVVLIWRYRSKPGAGWFLAALLAQALWGVVYAAALLTGAPALRRALGVVGGALLTALGAYFVAFALEYTGRGRLRGRPTGVAVALAPVVVLALAATNGMHGLLWAGTPEVVETAGVWGLEYEFRLVTQVLGGTAVGVVVLGSLLLFDTVVSYGSLYRGEAVAVGLSPVPPLSALVVWLFGVGATPELNFAPVLFLVHVGMDAYAFLGSDMFEFHPATRRRGERAAIDDLGNPVVIVDDQGRIVTTNDAAEDALDVDGRAVLTDPLAAHLDGDLDYREGGEVTVRNGGRHTYSVTAKPLTVDDDRVGYTLVWQDVTDARRREQRLAVLNRVLRHNLRNDMSVVRGFTSSARDRVDDPEVAEMLDTALAETDDLLSLGQTARDIERTLAGEPRRDAVDVAALVEAVAAAVDDDRVAVETTSATVTTDRETLRTVVAELVENGVEHASTGNRTGSGDGVEHASTGSQTRSGDSVEHAVPRDGENETDDATAQTTADGGVAAPVRVRVERTPTAVLVTVTDDGPGIPEGELAVVRSGEETALDHGSGLGLWLARWGVERIGADLSFETGPEGTTATVELPRSGDSGDQGEKSA